MARISVSKTAAVVLLRCLACCQTTAAQPVQGWTSHDKIALTYYFYWYDAHANYHFVNPDGSDALTNHPTEGYRGNYSWAEVAWHQRELADISAAKIDAVLPVYWGDQINTAAWSQAGIRNLVTAEQAMLQAGTPAPKIPLRRLITSIWRLMTVSSPPRQLRFGSPWSTWMWEQRRGGFNTTALTDPIPGART
jgi:hypothetical protein